MVERIPSATLYIKFFLYLLYFTVNNDKTKSFCMRKYFSHNIKLEIFITLLNFYLILHFIIYLYFNVMIFSILM
jgi:hypothetical protein